MGESTRLPFPEKKVEIAPDRAGAQEAAPGPRQYRRRQAPLAFWLPDPEVAIVIARQAVFERRDPTTSVPAAAVLLDPGGTLPGQRVLNALHAADLALKSLAR